MRTIIFFLLLLYSTFSSSFSQGFLHRDNKKIVDGNGQEVLLRGMGLGGWMLQEGYMMKTSAFAGTQHALKAKITDLIGEEGMNEFYDSWLRNHCTRADVDSLAKWGFNSIRLPMHYNLFTLPIEKEPVNGQNTWLEKGFVLVDSLLKWCTANRMYLILDLHAAPGGQGHDAAIADYDNTKPSLWESAANRSKTVELWKKLAQRYAGSNWIGGYDILNEPNWDLPGGTMLLQLYKDIIAAIRSVDNNHMIFIEGNWFANDFTGLLPSGSGGQLMDPNMAYSFHKYWNGTGTGSIQWMLDIRNNYNVPVWLGESGENSNEWFGRTIKTMEDNNIGWAWWPLKKIGQIVGPATIRETDEYKTLLNYWEKGGTRPSADFARKALLQIAENARMENCMVHPDVIDALFRQVKENNRIPFKNLSVPGTIALTDFDMGKVGKAYWDADYMNDKETSTEWNKGSEYRNDGVDIEKCTDTLNSNGYNIGWTVRNEWMKYTVNVAKDGFYDVVFRVSANASGGLFHVQVNSKDGTGTVIVPNTGGYQSWQSVTVKDIPLVKGVDTLTVKIDQGGFNISSMTWSGPTAVTSAPLRMLSAVTSEDGTKVYLNFSENLKSGLSLSASSFMLSKGAPVAIGSVENTSDARQIILYLSGTVTYTDVLMLSYTGTTISTADGKVLEKFDAKPVVNTMPATQFIPGKMEAESFSENYGFTTEDCSDTGGGKDMGYTDNGDFLEYLVFIKNAGSYSLEIRYSTPDENTKAELALFDNNSKTSLVTIDFPVTGGWQNWSTKTVTVTLPAGVHRLRYYVTSARFNTNYFNFISKVTSVEKVTAMNGVLVFPNPSHGTIQVLKDSQKKMLVEVTDTQGRVVYRKWTEGDQASIELSGKPKGLYIVRLKGDNFEVVRKIVVE